MQTSTLIVSLHDVSPLTLPKCREIVDDLRRAGVGKCSLLVIPWHHKLVHSEDSHDLRKWLNECVDLGDEVVLHGFTHQREVMAPEGALTRAITRHYTAGEGEFFDLPYEQARERLTDGRRVLETLGFESAGFIAPAWLLGKEAGQAVWDEGFEYTTRLGNIEVAESTPFATQSLVWSVRAGWRRSLSLAWNTTLFRRLKRCSVMRVGIHPPDWDFPAIRSQILGLVRSALAGRQAMTYEGWVNSTSLSS